MIADLFNSDTLSVAHSLLGKKLSTKQCSGYIYEVEAYIGEDDPACHACCGQTTRNKPMYKQAGTVYVYLIYGMYNCLNIVTEEAGYPAAVLIRGIITPEGQKIDGPGKVCRYLGIERSCSGLLLGDKSNIYLEGGLPVLSVITTPRIGIKQGLDKDWRLVAELEI